MKKINFFVVVLLSLFAILFAGDALAYYINQYGNCTYHAYRLCSGNSVYWYDSCDNQQDLFQVCSGQNITCKYGQCVYQQPYEPPYSAHYTTACYSNNLYWYDSLGKVNSLYKNCADTNSCTLDSCAGAKCSHTLKCDGSTCAAGSADYNSYCSSNTGTKILSVSFFVRQDQNSTQWQKTAQAIKNSNVYFMISVLNNSATSADNVMVSANIPNEIASLGNLKVDGVAVSGDIVSGINIGSVLGPNAKLITFEGKTQEFSTQGERQATAKASVSGAAQSDSVSINFNPNQSGSASVSASQATSGFWSFLKRWYLWILVALVLVFLFIVVFRRLSSSD